MSTDWPPDGIIYSETVVHTPPERYLSDAPYQLALIESAGGKRFTVRVEPETPAGRAEIGERVIFSEEREGVAFYRRAPAPFQLP